MPQHLIHTLLALTVLVAACNKTPDVQEGQPSPDPAAIDYHRSIGWLHGNCLAIMNPDLSPGTSITVVQPHQPPVVSNATIAERTSSSETCKALLEDRRKVNIESGYTFYSVHSKPEINLGFALLGNKIQPADYQFDYCNTREGLSFTVKARPEQGGAELWNGYYYLGYESEVTCPGNPG